MSDLTLHRSAPRAECDGLWSVSCSAPHLPDPLAATAYAVYFEAALAAAQHNVTHHQIPLPSWDALWSGITPYPPGTRPRRAQRRE